MSDARSSDPTAPVLMPSSIELLDVTRGPDAERFLWIRGLAERELPRLARIDLLDQITQVAQRSGELLHIVSRDGTTAASLLSLRTSSGDGSCHLAVHCAADPDPTILGDLVMLAEQRARAHGLPSIRCDVVEGRPYLDSLVTRHGFIESQRWRRFHAEVAITAPATDMPLPQGLTIATLRTRPDLIEPVGKLRRDAHAELSMESQVEDLGAAEWQRELDSAPTLGRELVLVLHDVDDHVIAHLELKRLAADSDDAAMELLAVERSERRRGYATMLLQQAITHAASLNMRRLHSTNHVDNVAACALNEQLGWIEDAPSIQLYRSLT